MGTEFEPYRLSYQIDTVAWDGSRIRRKPADGISRALDVLQETGIDMVMISGYHVEEPSDFDMDAETRRIGAELASRGMKAAQHHGLSASFARLSESQSEAIDHMKACVDYTANLGAEALVLHPGRPLGRFSEVGRALAVFNEEVDAHGLDAVIERCAENLREAGDYAEKAGVLVAFENVDRFEPLGNIADLPKMVEMADSPAVGYCLDSGHAHCCGTNVFDWINRMGDKLFTTHFHDNHGPDEAARNATGMIAPSGIDEHLPPGFGTIDWIGVIRALRRIGYSHAVNFESGPWPGMEVSAGFKAAIDYWRASEHLASTPHS